MHTPVNRTVLYALVITMLLVLAVGVNSVVYANSVGRKAERTSNETVAKSQQAWCAVINTLDEAYKQIPPTTQFGRQLADSIHNLKAQYHC